MNYIIKHNASNRYLSGRNNVHTYTTHLHHAQVFTTEHEAYLHRMPKEAVEPLLDQFTHQPIPPA